jgi:predicted small lipoprotein YifL
MKSGTAAFLSATALALALSGCGMRGPLYLPEKEPQAGSEAAQPAAGESAKTTAEPQPAPQAQKKDRESENGEQPPAPPAN